MKWFLCITCIALLSFATAAPMQEFAHEEVESMDLKGFVQLDSCNSLGLLHIDGSLVANHCLMEEVEVNGQIFLSRCLVKDLVNALGTFSAEQTVFQEIIALTVKQADFRQCRLQDMHVKKVGNFEGTQLIKLKKGTVIEGNITFDSKTGEVWLYQGSQIKGAVAGGKIIRLTQEE